MIPTMWAEELRALRIAQHQQYERARAAAEAKTAFVLEEGEVLITDAMFDALMATPVTAEEVTQLAEARGQYALGDTRAFVVAEEQRCLQYNCWMTRAADGSVQLVSERPGDSRNAATAAS